MDKNTNDITTKIEVKEGMFDFEAYFRSEFPPDYIPTKRKSSRVEVYVMQKSIGKGVKRAPSYYFSTSN